MIPWLLIVSLSWGPQIIVGQFPTLNACVTVVEAIDEALRALDEEEWEIECCLAGSCVLESTR